MTRVMSKALVKRARLQRNHPFPMCASQQHVHPNAYLIDITKGRYIWMPNSPFKRGFHLIAPPPLLSPNFSGGRGSKPPFETLL